MLDTLENWISDDPAIQERARAFNYYYIKTKCPRNIYHAFEELKFCPIPGTLRTAWSLRTVFHEMGLTADEIRKGEFKEKTGFLTPCIDPTVTFLWRAYFLELISLNPDEPLLSFSTNENNEVYLGLSWERGVPSKFDPHYALVDEEQTGENYLQVMLKSRLQADVEFYNGNCVPDLPHFIWHCAFAVVVENPNEKMPIIPMLRKLAPQIVPDVVIEYIKYTMTKPDGKDEKKKNYNMVAHILGVDYKAINDSTPLYNKHIRQYLEEELGQTNPKYEDLIPSGIIGLELEKKRLYKPVIKVNTNTKYRYTRRSY